MTRKLLLTSLGVTNEAIRAALVDLLGKPIEDATALFIPTAMYGFPDGEQYAREMRDRYAPLGWKTFSTVELSSLSQADTMRRFEALDSTDALLMGGGNAFFLSYWVQRSGLFDKLPSWLARGGVYVGESAGSMVVTAALNYDADKLEQAGEYFDDQYNEGQPKASGSARTLGLVDFVIRPHLNTDYFPNVTLDNTATWAARSGHPCYALDDQSALKVVDGYVEVVSQGEWKFFDAS